LVGEFIIEKHDITVPGEIIILPNKGMPVYKEDGKYGDLFVHVTVEFPYVLTNDEIESVKKLLATTSTEQEI